MKILITGDREWNKSEPIKAELDPLPRDTTIIHGACKGADSLAAYLAHKMGFFNIKDYPAKWKDEKGNYRPWAGPERNQEMLDKNPDIDLVLAFHPNILESKGTADMIERAKNANIEVKLIS